MVDAVGTTRTRGRWVIVGLLVVASVACSGGNDSAPVADDAEAPTTVAEIPEQSVPTTDLEVSEEPVASEGCGTSEASAEVEVEHMLVVGDVDRRYLLTVPTAHDGNNPLPVVFDFHGLMEGAEIHAGMSQYSPLAEEEGFVVVFPHGTGTPLSWNINSNIQPNPDVEYFDAVLAEVTSALCIDESRIYATGLSNGAMFTSVLLCQRADVLAAAAPVAGITNFDSCDPSRPVPTLTFHGTADPILLFNGGVDLSMIPGNTAEGDDVATTTRPPADLDGEGYPANLAAFADRNGCTPEPSDTEITTAVVHRVYDCPEGADVEFYIVVDGGHSWPGSEFSESIGDIVGPTTFDIDATRDAWGFFRRFSHAPSAP